jgi:hypothetical protein
VDGLTLLKIPGADCARLDAVLMLAEVPEV